MFHSDAAERMSSPLVSDAAVAAKWPNVPACYGWLSLDRRGSWRLKGELIRHAGLIGFINSHYGADCSGNWIFQNGPQTVFVALDYTPLVLRLGIGDELTAHTGVAVGPACEAYLDDQGNALLNTASGIGLLDDRDLPAFIAACRDEDGEPAGEDVLLRTMAGGTGASWLGLPLHGIDHREVPLRFGFQPEPAP